MPSDILGKISQMDQQLSKLLNKNNINILNTQNHTNLKPYKPHTEEQLQQIFQANAENPNTAAARRISAQADAYLHLPQKYLDKAKKLGVFPALNGVFQYALDMKTSNDPTEQQAIEQKNMEVLESLSTPEAQTAYLKNLKKKFLELDFSPLLSSDEGRVLQYMENNIQLIEQAWVFNGDFMNRLHDFKLDYTEDEQKIIDAKNSQLEMVADALSWAAFRASDVYPLVADSGYQKSVKSIADALLSNSDSFSLPIDTHGSEGEAANELNKQITRNGSYFTVHYQNAEILTQLSDRIDRENVIDIDGDPIEFMLQSGNLKMDGKEFPDRTTIAQVVDGIRTGKNITAVFPSREGNNPEPLNLKADNGQLIVYSAPAESMKERLFQLQDKLHQIGTRLTDSTEYRNMLLSLDTLADKLKKGMNPTCDELRDEMKNLFEHADKYYYAKLHQEHNATRSSRFDAAREIREMSAELRKRTPHRNPETDASLRTEHLKEDILAKYAKTAAILEVRGDKKLSAKQKEAKEQHIRKDGSFRKEFLRTVKELFRKLKNPKKQEEQKKDDEKYKKCIQDVSKLIEGKDAAQLCQLRGMSMKDFVTTMQQTNELATQADNVKSTQRKLAYDHANVTKAQDIPVK